MIGEGTEYDIEVRESDGLLPRLVRLAFDHILDGADESCEFTIGVATYAIVRFHHCLLTCVEWWYWCCNRSISRKIRYRGRFIMLYARREW
jgi:hypothetical protein